MKQSIITRYYEDEAVQCAEFMYGNGAFSMAVALPRARNGVDALIAALTPEMFDTWRRVPLRMVEVELPRFTVEYETTLDSALAAMGMEAAFTRAADFRGISADNRLSVSEVRHKSFMAVDEQGTEAAAVTSIGVRSTSMPVAPVRFAADHPFLYAIRENSTGAIVFIGVYGR
jgi:serpin B